MGPLFSSGSRVSEAIFFAVVLSRATVLLFSKTKPEKIQVIDRLRREKKTRDGVGRGPIIGGEAEDCRGNATRPPRTRDGGDFLRGESVVCQEPKKQGSLAPLWLSLSGM